MTSRSQNAPLNVPEFLDNGEASCASVDPELFFPQEEEIYPGKFISKYTDIAAAKRICDGCPLKFDCLEYGLKNAEIGIWGGQTENQRDAIRKRLRLVASRRRATPDSW